MAFAAGQKLTAAALAVFNAGGTTLSNDTAAAAATFEQWGTETIIFTNPAAPVKITANLTGQLQNTLNTDSNGAGRVGISFDGGASFTYGNAPGANQGTTSGTRCLIGAGHTRTGTPTGNVVVRAEFSVSTTNISALNGFINAVMVPQ